MRITLASSIASFTVALLCLFSSVAYAADATGLPCANPHAATTDDIAAGYPAGSQVCSKDEQGAVSVDSGQAKEYLQSILKGGSCGPYSTNATGLDPKFAICAARFMKDLRAKDSKYYVVSMYRSTAHQGYLCGGGCGAVNGPCAAAGSSKHQQGIAIDIGGQQIIPDWVHQMGQGYGIVFPVRGDSGHMQPSGNSSCADPNFKPTETGPGPQSAPSSNIANAIRQALGMNTSPPPAPPPPMQQSQQPLQYLPQTTTTGSDTGATASKIGNDTSSYTQQPISIPNLVSIPTSTKTIQNSTTTPYDRLMNLTNDESTTTANVVSNGPVSLNGNIEDAASIEGTVPTEDTQKLTASGTIAVAYPSAQQTFTSNDMRNNSSATNTTSNAPQQRGFLLSVLANLKSVLLNILQYLRPFGGHVHTNVVAE